MTTPQSPTPKVAVVGAGVIGRGWASLCASAGWQCAIFDTDTRVADRAVGEIERRARALAAMGRAPAETVERGLSQLRLGRSLLHACGDADWVVEAVGEDLRAKQRIFGNVGQVARPDAILTSSSSGLPISEIAAQTAYQARCLVAHPLNPPELIPLVEVVPGKFTEARAVDSVRNWLRALGRIPIVLKREVPGNVVGRIAAAV
jgi:3-hydroxypropionate dehydrogenase (NADP+)